MFEFLFKYPLSAFQQGRLELSVSWAVYAAIIAVLLLITVLFYRHVRAKTSSLDRIVLALFRTVLLAVIVFSLLQPILTLSTQLPQRNVVGVLIDDSRSMQIDDYNDDTPRSQFALDDLIAPNSGLLNNLQEQFDLRLFRFSTTTEAIENVSELSFSGGKTDLGQALNDAQRALSGLPLAGLLVISDGADNAGNSLTEPLLALRANSTPVYSIGVGGETFTRDIEISEVELPRQILNGTAMVANLTIRQTGYSGQTVSVVVENDGRILQTQEITLEPDGELMSLPLRFTLEEPGPRRLVFRIPLQDGEKIAQNNQQEALTLVNDRREKILYLEGQPRFELKFLRRAVADDEQLQLVALLRTAENKFYRLGIDDPDELVDGFPKTKEELFRYRGLVIGNVEAAFFSQEQLQMIVDYVSERGGGLLMLGGKKAFAEGGYADTPLADIIPVEFEARSDSSFMRTIAVQPTALGNSHPVTRLAPDEQASMLRWNTLPPLTAVNPIYRAKPGASVLLRGAASERVSNDENTSIVLAAQRYGRGRVITFAVQNAWLWQMHYDIPLEDQTHENLWRQMLRWLVNSVPERLEVTMPADRIAPGETLPITALFHNETFEPLDNSDIRALITSPTGEEQEITLTRSLAEKPDYQASWAPQQQGVYELRVQAFEGDEIVAERESYINVTEQAHEYHQAQMQSRVLQRIAAETGGQFYASADVNSLPDDLKPLPSDTTVLEQRELWDMPILFLLIILFITLEWSYRRWRGLI